MKRNYADPSIVATVGIMAALVAALTSVHIFQTPPGGYIHLGDIAVYFAALAMGPWAGMAVGGLGTALADVLAGYAIFAPISLVVHGLQGFVAGWLTRGSKTPARLAAGVLAGSVVLITGYFLAEIPMFGVGLAAQEVPWNIVQEAVGALGVGVYVSVSRAYPRLSHSD
jgi:uncharacterized membrane protein